MTNVAWSRDGDQWVTHLGKSEGRITEWMGPLGSAFSYQVNGKSKGQCGGGSRSDALKRAKAEVVKLIKAENAAQAERDLTYCNTMLGV
jgi:hypothetical protein